MGIIWKVDAFCWCVLLLKRGFLSFGCWEGREKKTIANPVKQILGSRHDLPLMAKFSATVLDPNFSLSSPYSPNRKRLFTKLKSNRRGFSNTILMKIAFLFEIWK